MVRRLKAIYSGNALIPREACDLPEGAIVDLVVEGLALEPPVIADPQERSRTLKAVVERMRRNPLPADAPRLTRDQMHERD